jgi:hypothetical protein
MKGSKAISPRVPAARKIPRLGKFVEKRLPDGTVRREWVHTDFATPDVVKPLVSAGWKPRRHDETADRMIVEVGLGPSELDGIPDWGDISNKIPDPVDGPSEIDEITDPHDLSNRIGQLVADYISQTHYQQAPKKFRLGAKSFHKAITGLEAKFPTPGTALAEALNDEIEKTDHPDVPDIELCRTVVRVLREASERVLKPGRGGTRTGQSTSASWDWPESTRSALAAGRRGCMTRLNNGRLVPFSNL